MYSLMDRANEPISVSTPEAAERAAEALRARKGVQYRIAKRPTNEWVPVNEWET